MTNRKNNSESELYNIEEILPISDIRVMLDNFYNLTGFGCRLISNSNKVLFSVGKVEICDNFYKTDKHGLKNCMSCDVYKKSEQDTDNNEIFTCNNGIQDLSGAIEIDGKIIARIYFGPFFLDNKVTGRPEFIAHGIERGYNKEVFAKAYKDIPVCNQKTIDNVIQFYTRFTKLISNQAYSKIKEIRDEKERREKVEYKLKESQEKLSLALLGASDGLWDWNMETDKVYFSPRWKEIIGYKEDEIQNEFSEWEKLVHPDDLIKIKDILSNFIAQKIEKYEVVFRMRHKKGRWIDILSRALLIKRNEDERPVRLVGTHTDVTQKLKTEKKIKEQEEKLLGLTNNALAGMVITDKKGKFVYSNDKWCDMTGYSHKEMMKKSYVELVHSESIDASDKLNNRLFCNEIEEFKLEKRYIRKDKTEFYGIKSVSGIKDDNGKVISAVGIIVDISDRYKIEAELKRNEIQLKMVTDNIPAMITFVDENLNYQFANQQYVSFLDLETKENCIGKHVKEVLGDDLFEYLKPKIKLVFKGETVQYETSYDKNGETHIFNTTLTPQFENEKCVGYFTMIQDVTQRKLNLKKIEENEKRLKEAERISNLGSIEYDLVKKKVVWSDQLFRILGYEPSSFKPTLRSFVRMIHANDYGKLKTNISKAIEKFQVFSLDFRIIRKDNKVRYINTSGEIIKENGIITRIIGSFIDITDQKEAEKALRISEERYKALFTGSSTVMLLVDPDTGDIMDVNGAACNFYGYNHEQMLSMKLDDILYNSLTELADEVLKAKQENRPQLFLQHKISNGKRFDVEVYSGQVYIKNKELSFLIVHDITKQKTIQKELVRSEQKFRTLVSNLRAFIFMINIEGEFLLSEGLEANELKLDVEDVLGRNIKEVFPNNPEIPRNVNLALKGRNVRYIHEIKGSFYDIQYTPVINEDGNVENVIGIAIDITKQKRVEGELSKSKLIAERASQAKSVFLANISHEIRTPLNAIIGFSELMDNKSEDPEIKGFVKTIKSSSNTLLSLINEILDLSKIEAGQMKLKPSQVDMRRVFREIEDVFSLKLKTKKLGFTHVIPNNFPQYILLDELRMHQVLINLMNNAVKFTETGYIEMSLEITRSGVLNNEFRTVDFVINIKDTGIGIDKDSQEKVFEAFRQTSEFDSRKYEGTGLGLTITRQLIELMNGKIELESEPDVGSVFKIYLKDVFVVSEEDYISKQKPKKPKIVQFEKAMVLVVDDVETNRILLCEHLRQCNIDTLEAADGKEGIEMAKEHKPDLIMMDLRMPVLDGIKATALLKEDSELKNIPIIAVTATTYEMEENGSAKELFSGYLKKPVTKNVLIQQLSMFLNQIQEEEKKEPQDELLIGVEKIQGIDKCIHKIQSELLPELFNVIDSPDFMEIEDFANKIIDIGKEYKFSGLEIYGRQIAQKAMGFDIPAIRILLNDFEDNIRKIEEYARRN